MMLVGRFAARMLNMPARRRPVLAAIAALGLVLGLSSVAPAQTLQLKNLKDAPTAIRFTLPTQLVWPANPGEPNLCLWNDDKFAAISITIDDNWVPDHPWWIERGNLHGFKFTWFVITNNVTSNPGFAGPWSQWRYIFSLGHAVQSHTVTHNHGALTFQQEYGDSITAIQDEIPADQVTCLAYPGGTAMGNDRTIADDYYIAARGTTGTPNKANRIDYLNTGSASGQCSRAYTDPILFGHSTITWLNNSNYLRAWLCVHYHGVTDKPTNAADLAYIKTQVDNGNLWFGLFSEVVRYGQERDTAHLTLLENSAQRVRFAISDDMDDTLFAYPLTFKVRLYSSWSQVVATQGGLAVPLQLVTHDGATFALVKAVPDRGDVILAPPSDLAITQWAVVADHGPAGNFTTPVSDGYVESRRRGLRTLQVTFSNPLDPATAQAGAVTVVGQSHGDQAALIQSFALSPDQKTLTANLASPLPNADRYTVTLTDTLRGAAGQTVTGDRSVALRALAGDADSSGQVAVLDLVTLRDQIGRPLSAATGRYDLDGSGTVDHADLLQARQRLGTAAP